MPPVHTLLRFEENGTGRRKRSIHIRFERPYTHKEACNYRRFWIFEEPEKILRQKCFSGNTLFSKGSTKRHRKRSKNHADTERKHEDAVITRVKKA